jgi:neutral ceramidase
MMQTPGSSRARGGRSPRTAWSLALLLGLSLPSGGLGQQPASPTKPAQDATAGASGTSGPAGFQVGTAACDITPARPVPLWGYGARHDRLSDGVIDRLQARAIVIEASGAKLAIVGMDLGRGPTPAMMERIRASVAPRGIDQLLICGSHTHHGPVIELTDQPGFGKGRFDDAVAYAKELPDKIAAAIRDADDRRQPARLGVAAKDVGLSRNRHTKRPVRPTDPGLTVIRFDHPDGSPIAVLVHYTAHPVLTPAERLSFSADYPGYLKARVEAGLKAPCVFIQGAAGDQSANPPEGKRDPKAFGELLGDHALALARGLKTEPPGHPRIAATTDRFHFSSRVNFKSAVTFMLYARSFFPELIRNFIKEFEDGMNPEMTTIVLNGELAIVGVPGEPFVQHALRLRERAYVPRTLVFGYCNGHLLYFPTIEAASEGGYGADPPVSPIELGAGEAMMDRALINIYRLTGKLSGSPAVPEPIRSVPSAGAGR